MNEKLQITENDLQKLIYEVLMEALEEKVTSEKDDAIPIDPDMNLGIESIY